MKKHSTLTFRALLVLPFLFLFLAAKADNPTYRCEIRNGSFVSDQIFEFDIYLTSTGSVSLELACFNTGILLNSGFINGGTITPSLVTGSDLNSTQVPLNIDYEQDFLCVKIAPRKPPRDYITGVTSGTVISSTTGTLVCKVRLSNTVAFGADPLNYDWSMNLMPYHTVVSAFIPAVSPFVNTSITNAVSHSKPQNLQLFLEGLYTAGTGNRKAQDESGNHFAGPVSDEITVELANGSMPYETVYTANNVLLYTNGKCAFSIPAELTGSYYIVVKHRNSIETWSAAPVTFTGSTISYDFSSAAGQAFGDNMIMLGSIYALFGGDATQDNIVDGSDMAVVDNASTSVATGYLAEDINGDGIVDGSDMAVIDNNSTGVISTIKP
ncbi:MAG: hypothetical protein IPH84_10855 [Bacteroidales bacterium]|nr:hypothetical protein [Bacteroidales bacterium]